MCLLPKTGTPALVIEGECFLFSVSMIYEYAEGLNLPFTFILVVFVGVLPAFVPSKQVICCIVFQICF